MKPLHKTYRFGREFMTDGCTGVTFENDGVHNECAYKACVTHDALYEVAATTRKEADKRLYNDLLACVSSFEAKVAYWLVRLGGWRRWGKSVRS